MQINRYYSPFGTVGYCPEVNLYTIERPWKKNRSGVSCIPEGKYSLIWHEPTSVSLPNGWTGTWCLVNREMGVTEYDEPNCRRWGVLLHVANWPEDIEGCIGWGLTHIIHDNRLMVTSSRNATERVLEYIRDNKVTEIEIRAWRPMV